MGMLALQRSALLYCEVFTKHEAMYRRSVQTNFADRRSQQRAFDFIEGSGHAANKARNVLLRCCTTPTRKNQEQEHRVSIRKQSVDLVLPRGVA